MYRAFCATQNFLFLSNPEPPSMVVQPGPLAVI